MRVDVINVCLGQPFIEKLIPPSYSEVHCRCYRATPVLERMNTASENGLSHKGAVNPEVSSDKVVRELDVCLSSGVLGSDTKVGKHCCWETSSSNHAPKHLAAAVLQLYLLQCPLRPPWRPYDLDHCKTVLVPLPLTGNLPKESTTTCTSFCSANA